MTYWAINAVFLTLAVLLATAAALSRRRSASRARQGHAHAARAFRTVPLLVTAAFLLVVTAVFDNVMIAVGLVGYDRELISGAFVGIAPLEDFAYAIGAVILLPALWVLFGRRANG